MRSFGTIFLTICFVSVCVLFSTGGSLFAQEEKAQGEVERLQTEKEALKKQVEDLRRQLEEVKGREGAVRVLVPTVRGAPPAEMVPEKPSAEVDKTSAPPISVEGPPVEDKGTRMSFLYTTPTISYTRIPDVVDFREMELENVMVSRGDAGLVTMLRFEKAKVCRKAGMHDKAVEELKKIIDLNLSEETTNAARWTLVEILQEQKKNQEALAELEKIVATIKDPRKKKDALYGIISLSGDDPQAKVRAIDRLIGELQQAPAAPPPKSTL